MSFMQDILKRNVPIWNECANMLLGVSVVQPHQSLRKGWKN